MIIRRNKKNRKTKNKKKESWFSFVKKVMFWTVFISFWGVAIWTLFFSNVMKVQYVVDASANIDLPDLHIEDHVQRIISGKFFNVVPKDNLLLISRKSIADELKKNHELIRDVSIAKKFPNSIIINIQQRESHIIWCNKQTCMLVDERGEAFCEVEDFDSNKNVKVLDTSDKPFILGDRVANPKFVIFSEQLPLAFLDDLHIEIEPILRTPSSISEEVRVVTNDGWKGFFSTTRPLEAQLKVLKKVLREKIQPMQMSQLEYVDLRIKGKATYRFREDNEEDEKRNDDIDNEKPGE